MSFYSTFEEQLSRRHPLYILANCINWRQFDEAFKDLYCVDNGRPAKPIRLMVSLLILKHIRNLSDESVVEQWAENSYYQYFEVHHALLHRRLAKLPNWFISENVLEKKVLN